MNTSYAKNSLRHGEQGNEVILWNLRIYKSVIRGGWVGVGVGADGVNLLPQTPSTSGRGSHFPRV